MARNVLVLATRHDAASSHTFQWAQELQRELFRYTDNCFFADATGLCRAGTSLSELVQAATHVVFYGHGEKDRWTVLPGSPPVPLVDVNTVTVLDHRQIYAGCCWSLTDLGYAFSKQCTGDYLGYDAEFGFDVMNENEFKQVVNQSVINYVTSGNAAQVVAGLQQEWSRLSNDFTLGNLKNRPNAVHAGFLADQNGQRIGKRP